MINIKDKKKCCGCAACVQACPKQCIVIQPDTEGFLYPKVDTSICVNCNICDTVCPVIHPFKSMAGIPDSYVSRSYDENLRSNSSSGGLFTMLASIIIEEGGVVFGAAFDNRWNVIHGWTDTITGLKKFQGSKYVQSRIGNSYYVAKKFLKEGRLVLFSGTPCQIAGLKHYLKKEYVNLISLDIVCHSIPSPLVWRMYLESVENRTFSKIKNITFRSKINGWREYGIRIESESKVLVEGSKSQNLYMKGFLNDLYTRPSCSDCPARNYNSGSDIMLADSWGLDIYHPGWDDNKGMSLVLIKTEKGNNIIGKIKKNLFIEAIPYNEVEDEGLHAPIRLSSKPHVLRRFFFRELAKGNVEALIERCLKLGDIYYKFKRTAKKTIKLLIPILFKNK